MPTIEALLIKQNEQLKQLLDLLAQELQHISHRDAESLLSVVEKKSALLDEIQALDDELKNSLGDADIKQLSDTERSLMGNANSLLEQCKHDTSVNEKAVEQGQLKLAHLRQLIVELRSRESLTYDKTGKTKSSVLGKGFSA